MKRIGLATMFALLAVMGTFGPLLPEIFNVKAETETGGSLELEQLDRRNSLPERGPGVSLPPGTVLYGTRDTPSMGLALDSSIPPRLFTGPDAFVYQTSFGQYSFNRTQPFLFRLYSRSGTPLTRGSMFFVFSSGLPLVPGAANVTVATDSNYRVTYEALLDNLVAGKLELRVDFFTTTKPKFTVTLTKTSELLNSFNIIWVTSSIPQWLKRGEHTPLLNVQAMTSDLRIDMVSSIDLGPSEDSSLWQEWVTTDWADAPGGRLDVASLNLPMLNGRGLKVSFPTDQAVIDPTQVATSSASFATAASTQRKTFTYGGYYFLFWYDGNDIVYSTSPNGVTWSSAIPTGSGLLNFGVDISVLGSTVAMAWMNYDSGAGGDGTTQLRFRKGMLLGNSITWDPIRTVAILPQPYSYYPSVAIGTDGSFWAGGIWYTAPPPTYIYNVWIYRSLDGISFGSPSVNYGTSNTGSRIESLQLIPLKGGKLMALTAHYYDSSIRYRIWNPVGTTGAYWGSIASVGLSLPTGTGKADLMSAVTTPDGDVHLLYRRTSPSNQIAWTYYNATSGQWATGVAVYTGVSRYPSISSDALGNLYAFWMAEVSGVPTYLKYSSRPKGQTWSASTDPFGSGPSTTNAAWLSASRTASKQVTLAWTLGPTPYKIYVGALPLPAGIASAPPSQPWNKIGVASLASSAEYVAPGNGLLAVGHTDISVPGRNGLDLSITRLYIQPFTVLNGNPFNYETSPYANLGNGWQLGLPWVGTQYLHSSNGQVFPIIWTNYTTTTNGTHILKTWTIENHESEDFLFSRTNDTDTSTGITITTYKLTTKDGMVYNFNSSGLVTTLVDRTGQNQVSFTYSGNTLSSITDTIGRVAIFQYDVSSRLANVTYGGQTVRYSYSGNNLISATDAMQRAVTFRYTAQSNWLISGIIYPTGGNSTYTFGSATIGTDAVNYYVTLQNVFAESLVRSTSFSYQVTDGTVTYASLTQSDGVAVQGYTNYEFSVQSKSMTVTTLDSAGVQMKKVRYWNDANGRQVQEDVYAGNTSTLSFYTRRSYDSWGNVIYTRDALGHESYQSFANTNTQYAFQSPGNMSITTDGKKFYDDFNLPTLDGGTWTQGGSATGRITTAAFSLLNLTGTSTSQGTWKSNWVRSSGTFGYPFYAEVQMSLGANPGSVSLDAEFILSPQATPSTGDPYVNADALRLILNDGPHYRVHKNVGGVLHIPVYDPGPVQGGTLSVSWKIILADRNTLTVFLNTGSGYTQVSQTTSLGLSSSFTPSYVYLALHNQNVASYSARFDYVGLTRSNSITINGLQAGQEFEVYDSNDVLQGVRTALSVDVMPMVFPYGYIKIYERDGRTVQFTSPTREVWGGSVYAYTPPSISGGVSRTTTGFLKASTVYIEDNVYTDAGGATYTSEGGDAWLFATRPYVPVVSGSSSHVGFTASGMHQHYFYGSSNTLYAAAGYFHVQYVYVPSNSVPSEVMLQFHEPGGWEHRAYWGSNSIGWGIDGTASRRPMGPLPAGRDQWLMFIVKTEDVGTNGLLIDGLAYTLYDGGVYWDYSALSWGNPSAGTMTVNSLLVGQKVELYDSNMVLKVSGTVQTGQSSVTLDVYSVGINVFPFKGYIKVYTTTNSLQYSSPLMTDIWGGDVYTYNQAVFSNSFDFGSIGESIHSAVIGSAGYQNATSIQEAYFTYSSIGNLLQQKQRYDSPSGMQWPTTASTFDTYGNPLTLTDARGNVTYFSYSASYQNAYLTNETRRDGSTQITTRYGYNFTTGNRLWVYDPRGYNTTYSYDILGRITRVNYPNGVDFMAYTYNDSANYVEITNRNGWRTRQIYDKLGRMSRVERFGVVSAKLRLYNVDASNVGGFFYKTATTWTQGSVTWNNAPATEGSALGSLGSVSINSWYEVDVTPLVTGSGVVSLKVTSTSSDGADYSSKEGANPPQLVVTVTNHPQTQVLTFTPTEDAYIRADQPNTNFGSATTLQVDNSPVKNFLLKFSVTGVGSYSNETTTYDWQNKVAAQVDATGNVTTYQYDYQGRLTSTTKPNGEIVRQFYNDTASWVRYTDEDNNYRCNLYDRAGRFTSVVEYAESDCKARPLTSQYYSTSYSYDWAGNLRKLTTAEYNWALNPGFETGNFGSWSQTGMIIRADYVHSGGYSAAPSYNPSNGIYSAFTLQQNFSASVPGSQIRSVQLWYRWGLSGDSAYVLYSDGGSSQTPLPFVSSWTLKSLPYDTSKQIIGIKVVRPSGQTTNIVLDDFVVNTSKTTNYSYDNLNRLTSAFFPDGTTMSYNYDNNSNIVKKIDQGGVKTLYSYDSLNRVKNVTYCGSTITSSSYTYDKNGNLLTLQNQNATLTYTYDSRNRPLTEKYEANLATRLVVDLGCSGSGGTWNTFGGISKTYTVSYAYNGELLDTITYPTVTITNIALKYSYDGLGRVSEVKSGTTSYAKFTYFRNDPLKSVVFGNGLVGNYTYDRLARPSTILLKDGAATRMSLTYGYNRTGTVATVAGSVNSVTVNEQYSYDPLRRLVNATVTSQGTSTTLWYEYDTLGNRMKQSQNGIITRYNYTYTKNQLVRSTSTSTPSTIVAYSYEANGNLKGQNVTTSGTVKWVYGWDGSNRLLKVTKDGVTKGIYAYDGLGRLVESIESSTAFLAYIGPATLFKNVSGSYSIDYLYAAGLRIATVDSSTGSYNTVKYYHVDHLGSTRLATSATKVVLFADSYQPFGQDNGTPTGSETYKFTGKPWSSDTGLYYYGARWYDPSVGRFISPDPRGGRLSNPQSLNLYVYVLNNPLRFVDPTGLRECGFWDVVCKASNLGESVVTGATAVANTVVSAYNSLSPEQKELLWIGIGIAATIATGGAAAPLVLGIGLAVGAGAVGVYAGYSYATGQQMTLHGALQAFSIGFAIGTVGAGLAVKAGLIGANAAKGAASVSNLGGRLGGPLHRAEVADIAADINARGLIAKTEYYVREVRRYADVVALDPTTRIPVEVYQVGRLTTRGLPVAREWAAIEDLESALEQIVRFIPYNV